MIALVLALSLCDQMPTADLAGAVSLPRQSLSEPLVLQADVLLPPPGTVLRRQLRSFDRPFGPTFWGAQWSIGQDDDPELLGVGIVSVLSLDGIRVYAQTDAGDWWRSEYVVDRAPVPDDVGLYRFTGWTAIGAVCPDADVIPAPPPPPPDPSCVAPFGSRAILVTPTALQKTGSGGSGSRARLDFQIASPNSPIVALEVRGNGAPLAVMEGTNLTDLAGMWFTVPASPVSLSVFALNRAGCQRDQTTGRTIGR